MAVFKDAIKTKDGRQWYFKVNYKDFSNKTRQYKSKRFLTKKEALDEQIRYLSRRDTPTHIKFVTVAQDYFVELAKKRKESSVYTYTKIYHSHILPYFSNYYIDKIKVAEIRAWRSEMEDKNFSISYLNNAYIVFKNIFDHAIKNYGLDSNPVHLLGPFESKNDQVLPDAYKIRYITYEEFEKFISTIDDQMWHAFFTLLYFTGVRRGEAVALKWSDIDFRDSYITINKTLYEEVKGKKIITSNKTNTNRLIKMNRVLIDELINYKKIIMKYHDFSENWFVFGNTINLAKTSIARAKHRYFEKSGVHEITVHEFRHSHVSLLLNEYLKSGQTDSTKFFLMMKDRMGHSLEVMLKTYSHLIPSHQDPLIDMLDNLSKK